MTRARVTSLARRAARCLAATVVLACSESTAPPTADRIDVQPGFLTVPVGGQVQLVARALNAAGDPASGVSVGYESDDTTVASVTSTGLATGVGPGTTSILVSGGGASARVPVRVGGPPATIDVSPALPSLRQDQTLQLTITVRDSQGYALTDAVVTYATSDASIVLASVTGVLTGVAGGTASVTVSAPPAVRTVPVSVFGRPAGTSVTTVALGERPYGVAVSPAGVVYVSRLDAAALSRTDLPATAFGATASVGNVPTDVAFDPTGTTAYVTNQLDAALGIVDVATNTQIGAIALNGNSFRVVVSPNGQRLYVTTNADNLLVIDRASRTILLEYLLGGPGTGLAFHPNGVLLYGTTLSGLVYEINTATDSARALQSVGGLQDITVSLDGVELYIANEAGPMQIRAAATGTLITTVPAVAGAFDLALSPDGAHLYAGISGTGPVRVLDRATRAVIGTFADIADPRRIAFDRYGRTAVVADQAGAVHFIR